MILTEQKALARQEEALLAAAHSKQQAADLNHASNQKKNAKLYKKLSDELRTKTNGRRSKVRVFRQCPADGNPDDYALQTLVGMTYFRVQYFLNVDENGKGLNGMAKHRLKITWSDHENPVLARQSRFQSEVFMNLYEGKQIYVKARDHLDTPEEAAQVKAYFKQLKKENPDFPEHIIQKNLFGFTVVQVEKGGNPVKNYNRAEVIPVQDDKGHFKAILKLRVKEEKLVILLHDVTKKVNVDGSVRNCKAAKMVGFIHQKSEAEKNEELHTAVTKLRSKKGKHADISETTTERIRMAKVKGIGEANEMGAENTSPVAKLIGRECETTVPTMQYLRFKGSYRSLVKVRSSLLVDSKWEARHCPVFRMHESQSLNICT